MIQFELDFNYKNNRESGLRQAFMAMNSLTIEKNVKSQTFMKER
ncbi:hypothetical protein CDIMF43_80009 [Carnobacterium divergens]|nr:hypothetical protein CDIV41_10009 [Carnobacterium divergens]SPC41767.1 hypothetical protein CDIMF43_80009 [Carnobacterium divergens]